MTFQWDRHVPAERRTEKNFLPAEVRLSHQYALYLHDRVVRILKHAHASQLVRVAFRPRSAEHASQTAHLGGVDLWTWLESNGYQDVVREMAFKEMFPALATDFCHFVFEALSCSRRNKLTVAYALLRKPFQDNLRQLEWLLADSDEFVTTFLERPASARESNARQSEAYSVPLIRRALAKTAAPALHDPQMIHDLRYDKDKHFSFDHLSQKAIHLVTTKPALLTEPQNVNFIFSNETSWASQWRHLYSTLPILLRYAVDICEPLAAIAFGEIAPGLAEFRARSTLGFFAWAYDLERARQLSGEMRSAASTLGAIKVNCPHCDRPARDSRIALRSLFFNGHLYCPRCRKQADSESYAATLHVPDPTEPPTLVN
ncbi:MAG: hypothetical protein IPH13_20735 [Planctomycetes bacterium]|nr:hypothetical protein [Planctomycetota bacterium]